MDLALVLIGCGLALLFVGLYPFGPYQLSLMLARRMHEFPPTPGAAAADTKSGSETFAICLCAYNEERVIREKVEDLLSPAGGVRRQARDSDLRRRRAGPHGGDPERRTRTGSRWSSRPSGVARLTA